MEITVWNYKEVEDEFLGEVLLDLSEARIDNTPTCYHLEDHDENSSPLPYRCIVHHAIRLMYFRPSHYPIFNS